MKNQEESREIWSCRLCSSTEEEATALLQQLREGGYSLWEDAQMLQRYIKLKECTQRECARLLDRSQAAIANRLRLLKLPEDVLFRLCEADLSERHGRALLRLSTDNERRRMLEIFIQRKMNVATAEDYIEQYLRTSKHMDDDESELLPAWLYHLEKLRSKGICSGLQVQDGPSSVTLMLCFPKGKK